MTGISSADLIRAFVRGDRDASVLSELGVELGLASTGYWIDARNAQPFAAVEVTVADVATGFVAACGGSPDDLRRWAFVVLGLTEIDLSCLDDDPDGEALRGALWDASFGDGTGLDLAARLAQRPA